MNKRENYIAIAKRTGYEFMPVHFSMCPSLSVKFDEYLKEHPISFSPSAYDIPGIPAITADRKVFEKYYEDINLKPGTHIDGWGVAHEPGSETAFHMTYMRNPMRDFDSVEQILSYPFPKLDMSGMAAQTEAVERIHDSGVAAVGNMQCTIWETAWYMRGMENLMCDMMSEDPMAEVLLDLVTDFSTRRAVAFAQSGADALFLGDDIGMQHTIMMSESLYCDWIKPRLKKVIDAAKAVNPDIVIFYHSCGRVTEMIPHLIDAGIDVLNPVQPECMDFRELHYKYGDRLSFHGTIGTQTLMPFGTPDEIRRTVHENFKIAGENGGLFICPTHLLEPEVPPENIAAYIEACAELSR